MNKKTVAARARPTPLDGALRLAIEAHQQGKLADAERRYRNILAAAPKHADALHYLGVALHQQGRHDAALMLIGQALAAAPGYTDARNNLGNVQKELGMAVEAEQSYRAVLAERPDFAPAWNNLGVVLKQQERYAQAAEAYRACLALAPGSADCRVNLGNAQRALGEMDGAIASYRAAIELAPRTLDAYRNLGQVLASGGRHAEALAVYRQWQLQDPADSAIEHMIAALEGGPAPERASDTYVQATFDRFASTFDDVLTDLQYRAPAVCGELLASVLGQPDGTRVVLDAGCGTGLCATMLLPYASALDGVDLSPKMLEKAAMRGAYRKLEAAELNAWLAATHARYDLIVSADTLCYFGALEDVAKNAARALRAGGYLVFTLEETDDGAQWPHFRLHPHGRYSHTEAYARAVLAEAGMTVLELRRETLRTEKSRPVDGLAIAARAS